MTPRGVRRLRRALSLLSLSQSLGMASLFVSSGVGALDNHGFMDRLAGARQRTWDGLGRAPATNGLDLPCSALEDLCSPAIAAPVMSYSKGII